MYLYHSKYVNVVMKEYPKEPPSEVELKSAAVFRDELHNQALEKIQVVRPDILAVKDPYPLEAWFEWNWEYPGAWYRYISIPKGFKGRKTFVEFLVKQTLEG